MKKFIIIILLFTSYIFLFAQERPGNNLGKSISDMRREFPELRYLGTEAKGDCYEAGFPEDGIAMFFYFKNGVVIEECLICETSDGFPKMWYDSLCKSFISKCPNALVQNTYNSKVFDFGNLKIHLLFFSENEKNTALIIYN